MGALDLMRESVAFAALEGNRAAIARRLNISRQHVNRVIEGKCDCSLELAHRIAMCARVTLDDLWTYRQAAKAARMEDLRSTVTKQKRTRLRASVFSARRRR